MKFTCPLCGAIISIPGQGCHVLCKLAYVDAFLNAINLQCISKASYLCCPSPSRPPLLPLYAAFIFYILSTQKMKKVSFGYGARAQRVDRQ